jgi:hypothetical protein
MIQIQHRQQIDERDAREASEWRRRMKRKRRHNNSRLRLLMKYCHREPRQHGKGGRP